MTAPHDALRPSVDRFWPRPAVLDRIPPTGDAVIEASAGTGKTYTLEHLVIDLIIGHGLPLEKILVVTFTEKAAAELSARLRSAMGRIHQGPWPGADPETGWRIDDVARRRLGRAITSFDSASISTIHAFCQRMLTEHAFVNGRLFREELVDGRAIFHEAFLTVVRRTLATDPRLQPYLAAWLQRAPLDALVDRLFDAHTRGGQIEPPYDASALQEILQALSRMALTPTALKPTLDRAGFRPPTTRAVLARIKTLRTIVETFAEDRNPAAVLAALDAEERRLSKDGGLFDYLTTTLRPTADDIPRIRDLYEAVAALRAQRVTLDSAVVQMALPIVQDKLLEHKRVSGRFDFDDMLQLLDVALSGPARDALLATLRGRFRVALIDEFQDTDRVQWSIFRQVFADSPDHRLIVIGDPKQAIYGFRGADVHTYLEARAYLTRVERPVVHLTETYRATPALAETLNVLLDQDRQPPFFTGEIRYDHPVKAAPAAPKLTIDGQAAAAVHVFSVEPKKESLSPSAAARTLNDRIAQEIESLLAHAKLEPATGGPARSLSAADIFILTRTTKEGTAVARALRLRNLPHAFYKQDGLFQTREATDIRNLLAAVAEPHDRARRLRAWIGPFFRVSMNEARNCLELPAGHPLLGSLFRYRAMADDKRWARMFSAILSETGIIERELLLSDSERELTNYLHIFEILLDDALRSRGTLTDLLHTLNAFIARRRLPEGEDGNVQRLESERAAVQIMTMHKAKGLEAPVVFITGGLDRNPGFAHIYHHEGQRRLHLGDDPPPAVEQEREEEDQRLAYVALTRAKSRVYLPFFGGTTRPVLKRLAGTYGPIDRALGRVLAAGKPSELAVESVPERPPRRSRAEDRPAPERRGSLPALPSPTPPSAAAQLRSRHRGRLVTSYSRLKESQGGYRPAPARADGDEVKVESEDRLAPPEIAADHLPGGTASGRFIHEMLELVDLQAVRRQAGWQFWAARPDVQTLFERGLRRYDRRPEHLPHSYALVYSALTTPLQLGPVPLTEGVAGADRVIREMEFLYPVESKRVGTSNRSYVKGFIDVVIEHDGRVIVLDWKTDLLGDYGPSLTAHVEANYALQADLYTLALLRLLGIEDRESYEARFGGTVYCFVRGLTGGGDGVYFTRPDFDDLQAAYARLVDTDLTALLHD